MKRNEILDTAKQYVSADRNADYDEPEQNFERIAALWNVALEGALKRGYVLPHEVASAMICVKLARLVTSPDKADHWIDLAGYSACGGECVIPESNTLLGQAVEEEIDKCFRPENRKRPEDFSSVDEYVQGYGVFFRKEDDDN